ncbi:hypothetical protein L596_030289 [Steinernema carpocapsae]|uniref:Uncharacterized protein n=1 Tax=Steinernema carpocapsae TaxID=34508 RepID=A0A4U5LP03_STECR|nr:hypothetical protein L596_030289 [Steinernema carpocapsae]
MHFRQFSPILDCFLLPSRVSCNSTMTQISAEVRKLVEENRIMKTALNKLGNDLVEEADENRELLQALKTRLDQLENTAARCIVDRLRAKRGVSQATSPARSTGGSGVRLRPRRLFGNHFDPLHAF